MQNIDRCASITAVNENPTSIASTYRFQQPQFDCIVNTKSSFVYILVIAVVALARSLCEKICRKKIPMIISNQTNDKNKKNSYVRVGSSAQVFSAGQKQWSAEYAMCCYFSRIFFFWNCVHLDCALRRKPISYVRLSIASRWQLTRPIGIVPSWCY